VWVAGVRIHGPGTLLLAAVLLGVVNAVVRPIAFILTLAAHHSHARTVPAGPERRDGRAGRSAPAGLSPRGVRAALLTAIIVWLNRLGRLGAQ